MGGWDGTWVAREERCGLLYHFGNGLWYGECKCRIIMRTLLYIDNMASGLRLDSTTNPLGVTQTPRGQPSATSLIR